MQKDKYIPAPVDTSDIQLPDELLPLIEKMAENVHEVWAKNRMAEGWTTAPCATTPSSNIRASYLTMNCPRVRKNMTATLRSKP